MGPLFQTQCWRRPTHTIDSSTFVNKLKKQNKYVVMVVACLLQSGLCSQVSGIDSDLMSPNL